MIIRFNEAQLSKEKRENLLCVLEVLQDGNEAEVDVAIIEFPKRFVVKLDNDVEMIIVWDDGKKSYGGLTEPEQEPTPAAKEEPEPDKQKDVDPIQLAALKYELSQKFISLPLEKKVIFGKELARLWSEHYGLS